MKSATHQKSATQAIHQLRCLALVGDPEAIAAIRDVALYACNTLQNLILNATNSDLPDNHIEAGKNALQLAKRSTRWPVAYDSIQEIRDADFSKLETLEIGSAIGIRLIGKRGMSYAEQTGFALDVFSELDAIRRHPEEHRHITTDFPKLASRGALTPAQNHRTWRHLAAELAPLAKDSLSAWILAGMEYCRDLCRNKPEPCQWGHRTGKNGLEIIPEDMAVDWSKFPWPATLTSKVGIDPSGDGWIRTEESAIRQKISEGLKALIPQSRPHK
jgi:hypothetical protein